MNRISYLKFILSLFFTFLFVTSSAQVFIPFSFWQKYIPPVVNVFTVTDASWSVPLNWNSSNNSIECIAGGGGGSSDGGNGGAGGGGGAYSKTFNTTLTPGVSTLNIQIGAGGAGTGGDSSVANNSGPVTIVLAKGGT
ncbi:MAG: glycine-rich domain-containing protein, partial [Bdellovibrionota bacterium]